MDHYLKQINFPADKNKFLELSTRLHPPVNWTCGQLCSKCFVRRSKYWECAKKIDAVIRPHSIITIGNSSRTSSSLQRQDHKLVFTSCSGSTRGWNLTSRCLVVSGDCIVGEYGRLSHPNWAHYNKSLLTHLLAYFLTQQ